MDKDIFTQEELEHAEYIKRRQNFWITLKTIRKEFLESKDSFDAYEFTDFVKETYGIQLNIVQGNFLGGTYEVVDEQKYLVYLLKFG